MMTVPSVAHEATEVPEDMGVGCGKDFIGITLKDKGLPYGNNKCLKPVSTLCSRFKIACDEEVCSCANTFTMGGEGGSYAHVSRARILGLVKCPFAPPTVEICIASIRCCGPWATMSS